MKADFSTLDNGRVVINFDRDTEDGIEYSVSVEELRQMLDKTHFGEDAPARVRMGDGWQWAKRTTVYRAGGYLFTTTEEANLYSNVPSTSVQVILFAGGKCYIISSDDFDDECASQPVFDTAQSAAKHNGWRKLTPAEREAMGLAHMERELK